MMSYGSVVQKGKASNSAKKQQKATAASATPAEDSLDPEKLASRTDTLSFVVEEMFDDGIASAIAVAAAGSKAVPEEEPLVRQSTSMVAESLFAHIIAELSA